MDRNGLGVFAFAQSALTADKAALVLGVAAGLAACLPPPVWRVARLVITTAHELGHVIVALLVSGREIRVDLWLDSAGQTTYSVPSHFGRLRQIAVVLAGYPGPGVAGVVGASMVAMGFARAWIAVSAVVTLVLLVLWVRNPWGVASMLLATVGLGWAARSGPAWPVTALGTALAVLLLVGGWRDAFTHAVSRGPAGSGGASDSVIASSLLRLPAPLWGWLLAALATMSLVVGGLLLLEEYLTP